MAYCKQCGKQVNNDAEFCPHCGTSRTPGAIIPAPHTENKDKKRKLNGFVKFLIVLASIISVLLLAWFSFGNQITLSLHSNTVVETINAGSLELPGAENPYSELPDYVKEMLDEDSMKQYGPVTETVLPYVHVEKGKVKGLFGASKVEYIITAPDMEAWLLNYEVSKKTTGDSMLREMKEYVKTAPVRTVCVTVEYYRPGFFSFDWEGNYYTSEFADAVCGGLNSAYNVLYEKAMEEMEALYE